MPLNIQALGLLAFFNSLVARIAKDIRLITMQQIHRFGDVMCVGSVTSTYSNGAVHQMSVQPMHCKQPFLLCL